MEGMDRGAILILKDGDRAEEGLLFSQDEARKGEKSCEKNHNWSTVGEAGYFNQGEKRKHLKGGKLKVVLFC